MLVFTAVSLLTGSLFFRTTPPMICFIISVQHVKALSLDSLSLEQLLIQKAWQESEQRFQRVRQGVKRWQWLVVFLRWELSSCCRLTCESGVTQEPLQIPAPLLSRQDVCTQGTCSGTHTHQGCVCVCGQWVNACRWLHHSSFAPHHHSLIHQTYLFPICLHSHISGRSERCCLDKLFRLGIYESLPLRTYI